MPNPEEVGPCSLLEESVPELSHNRHAGFGCGKSGNPFLAKEQQGLEPQAERGHNAFRNCKVFGMAGHCVKSEW